MSRICPQCAAEMQRDESRTEVVNYQGESLIVSGLAGWFCAACEEAIFDDESARRYAAAGDALIAKSHERQQAEIRRIRKKLGLTQVEAGRLLGVGKLAFSRYERGESPAPGPLVKLLRLVDRHPELVAEMRVT